MPEGQVAVESGSFRTFLVPSGDATWTNFTSNVEATLALACEDAGYAEIELGGTFYRVALMTVA